MKQKSDKPPKYLLEAFTRHMDLIFKEQPCMPFGTKPKVYNAYCNGKKEFYKLKKYLNG